MSEQKPQIVTNFIVRAIIGCAMIFFVSGILGTPGVALLYGISFYGFM